MISKLDVILRVILGGLFVYAGILKAWQPDQFLQDVLSYQILPHGIAVAVVWYLPYLEMVCGCLLWTRQFRNEAALVLLGLLAVFISALSAAWWRGLDISCGCFGGGGDVNIIWLILRDLMMAAGLLWVMWRSKSS